MKSAMTDPLKLAMRALHADDAPALRRVLDAHALKARINDPVASFNSPVINHVRSRAMLDALLDAGADINARSQWWAGGFGLLDFAAPDLAAYAIERGATVTVHAAARLGMFDCLRDLIAADPQLVHARGGDGQLPLHFASTIEIAAYLLDHGADINARDIDHVSTAAQYMVKSRPEIARYLISRGSDTDILMAAALGDLALIDQLLAADPDRIRTRVSDEYFPLIGSANGGTIYQWELGWHVSAVQVAKSFGHDAAFTHLLERCPADEKLLNACWLHDEPMVQSLLASQPDLAAALPPAGRRNLAHAARNNDTAAVKLMLTAGLPIDAFSQHHATALHWAAFHGNAELVRLLLARGAGAANTDNEYQSPPLGWAKYGSENGGGGEPSGYAAIIDALTNCK